MPDPSARIFVSYSRRDGAGCAAGLREKLRKRGFSVWQDLVALEGGRDWWSQIEDAIRSKALQHFVLVVTPAALASPVVRREIRLARQHDPDIRDAYFDGVLWVDLGEKPDNLLGTIADLVTVLTGTPPGLETITAAAAVLLGTRLGRLQIKSSQAGSMEMPAVRRLSIAVAVAVRASRSMPHGTARRRKIRLPTRATFARRGCQIR